MNGRKNGAFAALMAVIVLIIVVVGATEARAQGCNAVHVKNRTGCQLILCTSTIPSHTTCYVVAAFTDTTLTVPTNTPIIGAVNACNILELFMPATGCIWEIKLADNCCANICFNNCEITATPTVGPCSCHN